MSLQLQKRRTMGISNRSTSSIEPPKLVPRLRHRSFFLQVMLHQTHKRLLMCGDITLPRILTTVSDRFPLECWKKVLCTICSQVQIRGVGEEGTCVTAVQMEPQCVDWVDELSQVAITMRAGKAIGVDSIPPEACRVAGKAYWFLMCGKEASCATSQGNHVPLLHLNTRPPSSSPLHLAHWLVRL